jgi:S-formylglutathione hydrolase FrmB
VSSHPSEIADRARFGPLTRRWLLGTSVLVASALGPCAPAGAIAPTLQDADGIHVLSVKQLDSRLMASSVETSALPGPANIRILLPTGYAAHPRRRYPVLYLLHGTSGGASDWTTMGDTQQTTAGKPLIVVMPDIALNDDGGGWCTNWPDGAYRWEMFHVDQLIPWVDNNLRTIATRAGRAIAGLSQGGFCSMSYAARHPDLFSIALAYSGVPDIYYDSDARSGASAIINATEVGLDRVAPGSMFGDLATNGINWAAHDPATLAQNLRLTKMYLYWGNGLPGSYDSSPNPSGSAIEAGVWRDNNDFEARVHALGIPAYFDGYGNGTHTWPYWARDLRWSIDTMLADLAHTVPAPAAITYTSAENQYSVYGWTVATHRIAREFSTLRDAGQTGFRLAGSGSATVLTPAAYKPGTRYRVTLSGPHAAGTSGSRAGADRRLAIDVPLGPPNPYQQYTAQGDAAGTNVYTTTVTIAPAAAQGCPRATGRLRGTMLGPVTLGMTRTRARRAFTRVSTRERKDMDVFCLSAGRIRAGYPSRTLLRTLSAAERHRVKGRVVLALTASRHYALRGVRPGIRLGVISRKLRVGKPFHIGRNYWYLTRGTSATGVLEVRRGIIEEIGLADRSLTSTGRAARRFLASFS